MFVGLCVCRSVCLYVCRSVCLYVCKSVFVGLCVCMFVQSPDAVYSHDFKPLCGVL